jgi:NADPH:quinone reductase-like Zn-dependent oxidoreductase
MAETMRAAVADGPGGPEVLTVREVDRPSVRGGWALVRVKGCGLNRSELMTRQGHSPNVRFPRVLGIECVGVLEDPSDSGLAAGTSVAAIMGEMGRELDGGYAEYALLPNELLMQVPDTLEWAVLAALPETYLTAHGSLSALGVPDRDGSGVLLVRGGTSSVGMAALSLAKGRGLQTIATTRDPAKSRMLQAAGADHVVLDRGEDELTAQVRAICPDGPGYLLELVGATSTPHSLQLVAKRGTVCVSGMLSGSWAIREFEPVAHIPSGTKLTAFHSNDLRGKAGAAALTEIVEGVAAGRYRANVDRVFRLDDIVEAHRYMEDNRAIGKVVVLP